MRETICYVFHKIDKADCQGFEPHRSWASLNNSEDDWFSLRFLCVPKAVCLVKAMVFPIVMYRYESWIIKKAECQRIDAFELWYRRRLLRIPWTLRRWNQSVLKKINPEYSLKGLLLNLKLQYFGHLIRRADSLEKTPILGKIDGKRRREQQRMRWWENITHSVDMNLSKFWEIVKDREA